MLSPEEQADQDKEDTNSITCDSDNYLPVNQFCNSYYSTMEVKINNFFALVILCLLSGKYVSVLISFASAPGRHMFDQGFLRIFQTETGSLFASPRLLLDTCKNSTRLV